jgi:importin subunit beta-1
MVAPQADRLMTNLLQIIASSGKQSGVLEDAFATIGALAGALDGGFGKYLEAFAPYLFTGLASYEDWQVGQAAVYVVSDIARAVGPGITDYAERIMVALLEVLRSPIIERNVKPTAITAIGEVALALGNGFERFLPTTMEILSQAGSTAAPQNDPVMADFVWTMREAIVEAFIGIMNGLRTNREYCFGAFSLTSSRTVQDVRFRYHGLPQDVLQRRTTNGRFLHLWFGFDW